MSETIQKLMQNRQPDLTDPRREPTTAEIAAFRKGLQGALAGRIYKFAFIVGRDGHVRMEETTHFTTIN